MEKIQTKMICESTLKINVDISNNKGVAAFFNNIAGSISKYLIEKDLPLLYLEWTKNKRNDLLVFVFKEKEFFEYKDVCIELVNDFMKEVKELNVKQEINPKEVDNEFTCFKKFQDKLNQEDNIMNKILKIKPF